jgi:hypothetical protein
LTNSKLCFSPFGYGELCWRDIEGLSDGGCLIKPDMGHLQCPIFTSRASPTYTGALGFPQIEDVIGALIAAVAVSPANLDAHRALHIREAVDDMAALFTDFAMNYQHCSLALAMVQRPASRGR